MPVVVIQRVDQSVDETICEAIDVARKIGRDLTFQRCSGIDLIVGPNDTLDSVRRLIIDHTERPNAPLQ